MSLAPSRRIGFSSKVNQPVGPRPMKPKISNGNDRWRPGKSGKRRRSVFFLSPLPVCTLATCPCLFDVAGASLCSRNNPCVRDALEMEPFAYPLTLSLDTACHVHVLMSNAPLQLTMPSYGWYIMHMY